MKTTIYLDVDGVLIAETKRTPAYKTSGWEYWETKTVSRWLIAPRTRRFCLCMQSG